MRLSASVKHTYFLPYCPSSNTSQRKNTWEEIQQLGEAILASSIAPLLTQKSSSSGITSNAETALRWPRVKAAMIHCRASLTFYELYHSIWKISPF